MVDIVDNDHCHSIFQCVIFLSNKFFWMFSAINNLEMMYEEKEWDVLFILKILC